MVVGGFTQTGDAQLVDIATDTPRNSAVAASVKVTTSSSSTVAGGERRRNRLVQVTGANRARNRKGFACAGRGFNQALTL